MPSCNGNPLGAPRPEQVTFTISRSRHPHNQRSEHCTGASPALTFAAADLRSARRSVTAVPRSSKRREGADSSRCAARGRTGVGPESEQRESALEAETGRQLALDVQGYSGRASECRRRSAEAAASGISLDRAAHGSAPCSAQLAPRSSLRSMVSFLERRASWNGGRETLWGTWRWRTAFSRRRIFDVARGRVVQASDLEKDRNETT